MKRIQRKRTKGWRMPPNTVYVGRPTKWGNPFNWQDYTHIYSDADKKAAAKLAFEMWLTKNIYGSGALTPREIVDRRQWILDHLHELTGKDLACWCKPGEPCHADILLELCRENGDDNE